MQGHTSYRLCWIMRSYAPATCIGCTYWSLNPRRQGSHTWKDVIATQVRRTTIAWSPWLYYLWLTSDMALSYHSGGSSVSVAGTRYGSVLSCQSIALLMTLSLWLISDVALSLSYHMMLWWWFCPCGWHQRMWLCLSHGTLYCRGLLRQESFCVCYFYRYLDCFWSYRPDDLL